MSAKYLASRKDFIDLWSRSEYVRRMFSSQRPTWEGNTWVLDLLPSYPQQALDVLSAYFLAHCQHMPDGRISGFADAEMVIRARYLDFQHPKDALLELRPRDFEFLVAELYERMGYRTLVTRAVQDGGFDVEARRAAAGQKEHVLIECKLHAANIGVKEARSLSGVVEERRATKGVLVSGSAFTKQAMRFSKTSRRIDLVDFPALNKLFNQFLGADWPSRLNNLIVDQKRKAGGLQLET